MLSEAWVGFGLSVLLQLVIYLSLVKYHSSLRSELSRLPHYLCLGVLVGVFFDYLLGLKLGLWDYSLGFGPFFIIMNGFLLWGLFIAEVAILKNLSFIWFAISCVVVGYVVELLNLYLHAWEWKLFENQLLEYVLVVHILYPGFGLIAAFCLNRIKKQEFTNLK